MKKILILLVAIFTLSSYNSKAQEFQAYVVEDFPVQHMAGLKFRFNQHYSVHFGVGMLSQFYKDTYISNLSTSNVFEKNTKKFLEEHYDKGLSIMVGADYYYNDWYAGLYFQNFTIYADPRIKDLSTELLYSQGDKNYYQYHDYYRQYYLTTANVRIYNYNIGFQFGRELALTKHLKLKAELACAYSFYVKTKGYSDIYTIKSYADGLVKKTMRPDVTDMFKKKFTPSLRIGVVWRIGSQDRTDVGLFSKKRVSDLPKWE